MKVILIALALMTSTNIWAMNLTKKLQVTKIKFNEEKKNYDVSFQIRSGIYHADESHLKCLQSSIEKKVEVNVEFEAMGLKIVKCTSL
jgi:predicted transglutaminase-like protease